MSLLIAIPVFRISCNVGIDKGRGWSVVEELILWAITRQSKTISGLASETGLPPQIIVASIARLMRFRLVEGNPAEGDAAFGPVNTALRQSLVAIRFRFSRSGYRSASVL